jgi:predicted hydrocarbon binding protein
MGAPEVTIDVDPATGIWRTDGVPMIYLPRHFLVNNHKATEAALGRDAYATMIRIATDKSAFDWCTKQSQRNSVTPEDVFRLYFKRLSQRGWGRFSIEMLNVDAGQVSLRLDQSVFVLEGKQNSNHALCYMFEGFVTGALRVLLQDVQQVSTLYCNETECAAQGHSEFCRFQAERYDIRNLAGQS